MASDNLIGLLPQYTWGESVAARHRLALIKAQDGWYVRGVIRNLDQTILTVVGLYRQENFPDLPPATTGVTLGVNKIPLSAFNEVLNFFRWVYQEHRSEAIVLLYLNPKENGGTWQLEPPPQEVTGGSVSYSEPKLALPADWYHGGSIHSHAGMSAFSSPTDKNDERNSFGLHIIVGKHQDIVSYVCIGHWRFEVQPEQLIELPSRTFPENWKSMVQPKGYTYSLSTLTGKWRYRFNGNQAQNNSNHRSRRYW